MELNPWYRMLCIDIAYTMIQGEKATDVSFFKRNSPLLRVMLQNRLADKWRMFGNVFFKILQVQKIPKISLS